MKVTDIKETGCNNLLCWAIKNGANIKQDTPLQSLINDELSYLVTFSDVTFFELFRLTQMYRDDLAIIATAPADLPSEFDLISRFPGEHTKSDTGEKIPYWKVAADSINPMINLVLQMQTDDDIIPSSVPQLFLPMISRRYDVQIPVSFYDFIGFFTSNEEASSLYNLAYPDNLRACTIDNEDSSVIRMLMLGFIRATNIIKYNKKYDEYLNAMKYRKISSYKSNSLYKIRLDGFYKNNPISRANLRCSMFNASKSRMAATMNSLKYCNDSLKVEFMVQMPIFHMQNLLNHFSPEAISVRYESSMSNIISNGTGNLDFVTYEFNAESNQFADEPKPDADIARTSTYKIRISEVIKNSLTAIQAIIASGDSDADTNSVFSLLPSIYRVNALVTIDLKYGDQYTQYTADPVIANMLRDMMNIANSVQAEIQNIPLRSDN